MTTERSRRSKSDLLQAFGFSGQTVAKQAGSPRGSENQAGSAAPATRDFPSSNDDNQRQVEKRAQASVQELPAESRKNRATTITAVEQADRALLVRLIRSAGGATGALSDVIYAVAVQHVLGHAGDVLGDSLTDEQW